MTNPFRIIKETTLGYSIPKNAIWSVVKTFNDKN